jgi:hypothetical protein
MSLSFFVGIIILCYGIITKSGKDTSCYPEDVKIDIAAKQIRNMNINQNKLMLLDKKYRLHVYDLCKNKKIQTILLLEGKK